jgi:hypothetical protein
LEGSGHGLNDKLQRNLTGRAEGDHEKTSIKIANPEDGGDTFLRNVGYHSTHYTASYPRKRYSAF